MKLSAVLTGLLVAASAGPAVRAQQIGRGITAPTNLEYISQRLAEKKGVRPPAEAEVRGTPLLLPYWTRGRVVTSTGPVSAVWLKYNLASGQLLWRRPAGDSLEINTAGVTEFTLGDSLRGSRATFRRYLAARIENPALRTAFFEVLYDAGKSALLCQRTKALTHMGTASPSLTAAAPPSWRGQSQFFIKRADNAVVPIRLAEKSVLEAVGMGLAPALVAYARQNRLSFKQEADVAKLLAYYDTL
ncbi:hypothetical protein [Hymenobacter cheonanensis]|uniref:hypothetical protein n=1 Tax=Hymenobacter sp. CA2-7 TaxID=3063993 RepID=UPI002712467D|nr:hypothetical protein [Hymenobacter sp. CA2-7]MDO7887471.1 hypothetical protein [Hymenobacter sp. CA2-7]